MEWINTHGTFNGARDQTCPMLTLKIFGVKSWVDNGLDRFLYQNPQLKTVEILPLETAVTNRLYSTYGTVFRELRGAVESLTVVASDTF